MLEHIRPLIPYLVFMAFCLVGLILRVYLYRGLDRWSKTTTNTIDDAIVISTRFPSFFWVVLIAVYFSLKYVNLPPHQLELSHKAIEVTLIFSIAIAIAHVLKLTIQDYGAKLGDHVPFTSLSQHLSSIIVLAIAILMILNVMGISVPSFLTALGIGGLAVALALQDTLSNLFSGIYLVGAHNVRTGDYIKLDSGEEGYVTDISLRVTKIKTYQNNVIIIPNQKLAQAIITNFYLPEKQMTLMVPISTSYESDPKKVENIIVEEAQKACLEVKGLVPKPEPFVRFIPGFGESSLGFTLFCQIEEFMDHFLAEDELRIRIFNRFRKEGIEIPFPQRVIHMKQPKP